MCVLLCAPRRVDCYVYFILSVLPRAFRVGFAVPLCRSRNFRFPGYLIQEVECYVMSDSIGEHYAMCDSIGEYGSKLLFSCGCPRKNRDSR